MLSIALTDLELTEKELGTTRVYTQPLDKFTFAAGGSIGVGYKIGKGNIVLDIRGFGTISADWNGLHNGLPMVLLGYEFWF